MNQFYEQARALAHSLPLCDLGSREGLIAIEIGLREAYRMGRQSVGGGGVRESFEPHEEAENFIKEAIDSAPEPLRPCPFCGGKATRQDIDYNTMGAEPDDPNYDGSFIECDDCGACSHVEFGFKENLVSLWNMRANVRAGIDLEDVAT